LYASSDPQAKAKASSSSELSEEIFKGANKSSSYKQLQNPHHVNDDISAIAR
jgi:hypothetical protein